MATAFDSAKTCPRCGSRMEPDYDGTNAVRVLACTKPTCLFRMYPDYPSRSGNQEICYICGDVFTLKGDCMGVLCPRCKKAANEARRPTRAGRPRQKAYRQLRT